MKMENFRLMSFEKINLSRRFGKPDEIWEEKNFLVFHYSVYYQNSFVLCKRSSLHVTNSVDSITVNLLFPDLGYYRPREIQRTICLILQRRRLLCFSLWRNKQKVFWRFRLMAIGVFASRYSTWVRQIPVCAFR